MNQTRCVLFGAMLLLAATLLSSTLSAAPVSPQGNVAGDSQVEGQAPPAKSAGASLDFRDLMRAGGTVGYIICLLSVAMVALIVEHAMSIRRPAMIPPGLADDAYKLINGGRYKQADELCQQPGFLPRVLSAGLMEIGLGYNSVEKSMESAAAEQAARLFRKIEYLSVIGTLAPMLGLLGTVWGMILAFVEFESKANPQVSELAPGIYKALVTTLLGLGVAVPALGAFAFFRNRIDELVAEATLTAESVFADYKRAVFQRAQQQRAAAAGAPAAKQKTGPSAQG